MGKKPRRYDSEIKQRNGVPDEILGYGNLHIERMDSTSFWARLDRLDGGPDVVMWFVATKDGQLHLKAELDTERFKRESRLPRGLVSG